MASSSSSGNTIDGTGLMARRVAQFLLLLMSLMSLYTCPHSKVEESFNLQATHDLVYHGLTPALQSTTTTDLPYDHLSYPGVVPRTFLGPLIVSWIIQLVRIPFLPCVDLLDHSSWVQFLARFILLLATVLSWCQVASAVDRNTRQEVSSTGTYLLLITACQFHMPFYASRMLPNVFALIVVLQCFRAWLEGNTTRAAALLVFATAVFRCDLLLLLLTVGLSWLMTQKLSIPQALQIGVVTGVVSLLITVPLDSLLWQRWVWPEGEVLYYNTILGKSSDWGTSPWHWYVTKALPKIMLGTLALVPCGFLALPEAIVTRWEARQQQSTATQSLLDTTWWEYLLPAIGYIGLYSCLGHKEVRFLFPVVPLLNLAAAIGMTRFHKLVFGAAPQAKDKRPRGGSRLAQLGFVACWGLLAVSLLSSVAFVAVSQQNYPGGEALRRLQQHFNQHQQELGLSPHEPEVRLYIDVAAAMSGISLFGQRQAEQSVPSLNWKVTKAGYEDQHALKEDLFEYSASFSHIIAEADPSPTNDVSKLSTNAFTLVDVVPGQPRLDLRNGRIATQDYLYIWERIGYWQGIRGL